MKTAVVILPTYNEKGNIGRLIDRIQREFARITNYSMKILVVDDNSPDGTQTIVRQAMRRWPNVELLVGEKKGLGQAYIRGIDFAIKKMRAAVIFEMDADFSHHPPKIPKLLAKLDQGFDVVVGARYIPGGSIPANWGIHRKILSRAGNTLVRTILMRFDIHDWTNGFRVVRAKVFADVRKELVNFTSYTFQVAFLHKALLRGYKVAEIPINFTDRYLGKSKIPIPEYIFNLLLYLVRQTLLHPPRPLKFILVGALGFLIQFFIFRLFRGFGLRPTLATVISAELAILSNFIWNNLWTFAERRITKFSRLAYKFFEFNLTSLGSLVIQAVVSEVGTRLIGIRPAFSLAGVQLFSDDLYLIAGILLGLVWNYSMYNLVVWKQPSRD